jgi:hypothetical protein
MGRYGGNNKWRATLKRGDKDKLRRNVFDGRGSSHTGDTFTLQGASARRFCSSTGLSLRVTILVFSDRRFISKLK